ncbi:hypothetical protein MesoLj131c_63730 [Mesorhizobium sp. 131-3-5]|uniref:hypothetical protein n=1 Tax=Mesorhizobium sp. 131-3-5 TaxID=2744520 RepID=UPI001927EAF6|nr:hypothetical protein [Mesorhizobium sp. 131-3-5]BCH12115.1 hypothetical protein MesoLj131c_63730 [Mesorhizobium sp. 131-3-5]
MEKKLAWTISIVALLNSIVSVFVVVVPIAVNLFTPKNSDLIYSIHANADRSIGILVSNSGIRAGTISGASLSGQIGDEEINSLELEIAELGGRAAIVSPSETRLLALTVSKQVPGVRVFDILPCGRAVTVSIDVRSIDFQGQRHEDNLPIHCAEQRDFLMSLAEEDALKKSPPP